MFRSPFPSRSLGTPAAAQSELVAAGV